MKSMQLVGPFLIILLMTFTAEAKGWKGIIPLHSTRADVERLLGEPNSAYGRYVIEGEEADIRYSRDRCTSGWDVPPDTVIDIAVTSKSRTKISELRIDFTQFNVFDDPSVPHKYYANGKEGIRYDVFSGSGENAGLILITYFEPTIDDAKKLRCSQDKPKPCPSSSLLYSHVQ